MTDYEKTKQFLSGLGVTFDEKKDDDSMWIVCEEGVHDRVVGYSGFYTYFNFKLDGSFVDMGAGE